MAISKSADRKYEILETQASSNALQPEDDNNALDPTSIPASEEFPQVDKTNERRNAFSAESEEVRGKGMQPPPTGFEPPRILPQHNQEFRNREESRLKQLGLPLQSPAKTSHFVNQPKSAPSAFRAQQSPIAAPSFQQTQTLRPVTPSFQSTKKPGVKTFDPDKNYKAFEHIFQPGKKATHKDYDFSRYFTKKEGQPTNAPVQRRQDFSNRQKQVAATTQRPAQSFQHRPAATQRAVAATARPVATARAPVVTARPVQVVTTRRTTQATTTQAPRAHAFNQAQKNNQFTRKTPVVTSAPRIPAFNQNAITPQRVASTVPARDLLPPINAVINYEDATTKGPPIYFEWKVPDRGLLPPKLDNETDVQSKHNTRSITEEGNFQGGNDFQSSESRRFGSGSNNGNSIKIQYKDLQKMFSIPEFEFPIEASGREGYDKVEALNSFQVKIPYKSGNADRYYYLEHTHCNPGETDSETSLM